MVNVLLMEQPGHASPSHPRKAEKPTASRHEDGQSTLLLALGKQAGRSINQQVDVPTKPRSFPLLLSGSGIAARSKPLGEVLLCARKRGEEEGRLSAFSARRCSASAEPTEQKQKHRI
jgi:hypothetical protein